jgi:membrane-associated phospholipid phosphatase
VFPTAPPRLSDLGILDTISGHGRVNLDKGLVSALYNPYAAVPSMHAGYALVVGSTLVQQGRHFMTRLAGAVYPALIILVIVATGNHFLLDAAAGMLVVALAAGASWMMLRRSADAPSRRSDGAATYRSLSPLQTHASGTPSAESPAPRPWPPGSSSVSGQPRIPQLRGP